MKIHKVLAVGFLLGVMLLIVQAPALMAQEEQDPPGRVARLSFSDGSVSFQPGGEGDWVEAVRNRPLTTGDNLWADKDSRAELQSGSTSIRLDSETSMTILDLDDRTTQLRLSQGSIIVLVRHLDDEDHFEVDTPNLAFEIQHSGEYRIDVNADGTETDTTVWRGRGEVTGGGSSFVVVAGQRARFSGTDQLDHEIDQIPNRDDFDDWAFNRDQREDRAESANYISPEMTGSEDLDEYGHWRYVADYGPVWSPIGVAPGWAPYRFGHWAWVEPWGWTWVEDEPWGFAPFHYGRWAFVEGGWCWVPGPVVVRPVFAPALVAFVGGGGFSAGFGVGAGVAWFPLAPREVFVPWYRTSPAYVNNVNVTNTRVNITQVTNVYNTYNTNTTNITRITYVNQHVNNAVTAVSHETFVNARPVANNLARVDAKQIENAPVTRTIAVQPAKQSVLGAGKPAAVKPPAAVLNRQVVATRQPTPPRAPFEQRQPTMNVRTEAPQQPQPAARPSNEPARPEPPSARTNEPAHPAEPARPAEPSRAAEPVHPAQPTPPPPAERNVPRPGNAPVANMPRQPEPAQPAARPMPPRPEERAAPRPPVEGSHPLVRPAPPIQERPEVQRNEQSKFNAWQQQRQNAPHEAPRPQERAPASPPSHPAPQPAHPVPQPSHPAPHN